MKHGSLFSGIGGFDLAAEWMGWTNIFHCEIEEFPQKVLKYYWPNAISYGDITKTDFTIHRGQIDVLTGGFPCQPFSLAGKRKGTEDHRNLWPEMLRAIQEIQPVWIVGENVPVLINWSEGLVFEQVQADLENEGYEVTPYILPACSQDAPHRRERVWFVAYSESNDNRKQKGKINNTGQDECRRETTIWTEFTGYGDNGTTSDTNLQRNNRTERTEANNLERKQSENTQQNGDRWASEANRFAHERVTSDTESKQSERVQFEQREFGEQEQREFRGNSSGMGNGFIRPNWQNFPTQSPVCSGNDGISSKLDGITFPKWRNESIKAYGNAIVPQVVYQIFKVINEMSVQKEK